MPTLTHHSVNPFPQAPKRKENRSYISQSYRTRNLSPPAYPTNQSISLQPRPPSRQLRQSQWPSRNTRSSSTTAAPSVARRLTLARMTTAQKARTARAARTEAALHLHMAARGLSRPIGWAALHESVRPGPENTCRTPCTPDAQFLTGRRHLLSLGRLETAYPVHPFA